MKSSTSIILNQHAIASTEASDLAGYPTVHGALVSRRRWSSHIPPSFMTVFDEQELARLTIPVLLLIGENKVLYRKEAPHLLERAGRPIPGIQTELIPCGGTSSHLIRLKPSTMHCWRSYEEKLR